MQLVVLFLLFAIPLFGGLTDPGEGLATRAERRTARLTSWQAWYESASEEQIQNQARVAVEDFFEPTCLNAVARIVMDNPSATTLQVEEWVEDHLRALNKADVPVVLRTICPEPPMPAAETYQGEHMSRVLIIRGSLVADGIRSLLPVLPRIGGVRALHWSIGAEGTCTVGGSTGPCFAVHHTWHEAHLHLLEAIIRSEGYTNNFELVPLSTWRTDTSWVDNAP